MLEFRGDRRGLVMGERFQNAPCYYSRIVCCCYSAVSDSIQLVSVHDAVRACGGCRLRRQSNRPPDHPRIGFGRLRSQHGKTRPGGITKRRRACAMSAD
jgi:hypothetical protein